MGGSLTRIRTWLLTWASQRNTLPATGTRGLAEGAQGVQARRPVVAPTMVEWRLESKACSGGGRADGSTACGPRGGGRLCAAGWSGTRSGCVLEVVQVDKGRTFVCCSRRILASMWLSGLKLECVSLYCCRLHHHQHQSIFSPQRGHRFHPSSDSEISKLRSERSGYGGPRGPTSQTRSRGFERRT